MTWQSEVRAWAVASAAAFCLATIGYKAAKLPDIAPTVSHLDGVLTNADTATSAWSDASKQQVQSVSAIERDIRAQLWHVDRTLTTADGTLVAAQGAIIHVGPLLDTAKDQLTHVGPLLDAAKGVADSLPLAVHQITWDANTITLSANGFLTNPHLTHTFENVDNMTDSGAGIMWDARTLSDKYADEQLKPVKWYMYPLKRGGELLDVGSAIARHAP